MVLTYPIFCCRWRLVYFLVFAMNLVTSRNFYWTPSSNTSKWYSPLDLCLLSNSSKIQIEVIMADCRRKVTEAVASKMPVRCTLGNSWPSSSGFCSSLDMPYTERDTFQNAAIGYDDPSSHPLRNFFRQLSKEKGSVLLIGDSVMQQFFSAIACELEREGIWDDPNQFQNTDELKLVNIGGPSSLMHAVPIKFTPIYHFVNGRYDRVVNASMVAMKKSVEEFLKLYKSVYIVINMGLHYVPNPEKHHARPDYRKQMAMALRYLHSVAIDHPGVRIFWRETSAQHFRTSNGCKSICKVVQVNEQIDLLYFIYVSAATNIAFIIHIWLQHQTISNCLCVMI